jgi:hypothetical protein
MTYDVQLLDQFRQGIPADGLEVYYPVHTLAQTAMYREYTQRHHLLTSAGSNSRSPNKPPIKYRAELSRGLLERLGIQVRKQNHKSEGSPSPARKTTHFAARTTDVIN